MDEKISKAHEKLSSAFREIGFRLQNTSGVIDGVKVYDRANRYLFSWHKNPHHLLFYLRIPALNAKSTLSQKAATRHSAEQMNINPTRETTIKLNGLHDAETLLGWLLPELPLP
jgi:hypothetical protein